MKHELVSKKSIALGLSVLVFLLTFVGWKSHTIRFHFDGTGDEEILGI